MIEVTIMKLKKFSRKSTLHNKDCEVVINLKELHKSSVLLVIDAAVLIMQQQ